MFGGGNTGASGPCFLICCLVGSCLRFITLPTALQVRLQTDGIKTATSDPIIGTFYILCLGEGTLASGKFFRVRGRVFEQLNLMAASPTALHKSPAWRLAWKT